MAGEGPLGEWNAALQKAQAELMRQWMDMNAASAQGPSAGAFDGQATAQRFLAQCEQYLGVSRSLWDLLGRATAAPDAEARLHVFNEGLATLQQQFAGLWAATPFGAAGVAAPGSLASALAGALPGGSTGLPPNPFAAWAAAAAQSGFPGAGFPGAGFPGAGFPGAGFPGAGLFPGMGQGFAGAGAGMAGLFSQPALGPAREQQQAWQRMGQLAARCGQAQLAVVNQWNDIIGRSVRELGGRLAPRLKEGAAPGSLKEIYDLWVDSAEGVYAQAARNAGFVQAQAELTNALAGLRTAQRELVEEWARQFDLPTRAELNSLHQQLRELKAALRR